MGGIVLHDRAAVATLVPEPRSVLPPRSPVGGESRESMPPQTVTASQRACGAAAPQ